MIEYPNQRVSRNAKLEDKFYKPTYDYLISKALALNDKTDITTWLSAANGDISNATIKYLVSPIMDTETQKTVGKLPGEIRDVNLINTIRERNIGEYIGIPYKFTVTVLNNDAALRRDLEVREEVNKLMQASLIKLLNDYYQQQADAAQSGQQPPELPDIEKHAKDFIEKWIDQRAINGKNILEFINSLNDFDTKRIQSFFYWWACEEFYTYREIINNEVYTYNISPLEGFPIYNDAQFVEDYTGFVIKKKTTLSQIKALYWDKLSDTEKKHIESLVQKADGKFVSTGTWLASRTWYPEQVGDFNTNAVKEFDVTDSFEQITEFTVIWRTEVPIKIRKFTDPFGVKQEEIVPEDYVRTELDDDVIEHWIEEVYIGKRFGNETTGIYLTPEPCSVQRYDKHTMSPKLPVGGKKGLLRNIAQNPLPKRLIPYVIIDRMLLLQQERALAKYQGYLQVIPKSMLNDDTMGTRNEKLFYIKADNTLFYDDSLVDFNTVAQGLRVINFPAMEEYLKTIIDLREKYKQEALEIANMNNNRLGDIPPSIGKGVMQESIYRASLGNVLMITMFNQALQKDHEADLEFSKIAYQDNIRGSYIDKSTGKPIYLDININEHRETSYGIFVENSKLDKEKIDYLKQIGFNASQNGDTDSAIAATEFDSVPELRQALKEISKANKEFEASLEQNKNATQQYVAELDRAKQDSINETTKYVAELQSETSIQVAEINASAKVDNDAGQVEYDDDSEQRLQFQRDQLNFKRQDANAKNLLQEKKLRSSENMKRESLKASVNLSKQK